MTDQCRVEMVRRGLAGFALLLFAATWKLWTPQIDFPQIPVFSWLVQTPTAVDWLAGAAAAIGLVTAVVTQRFARGSTALFSLAIVVLVLLNQHRLQPWVYLLLVFGVYVVTLPADEAVVWMRRTVASIYVYSAISKLDCQFTFTVGQQMVGVLLSFFGCDAQLLSDEVKIALAVALPVAELVVGLLLCWSRLSRIAGGLAIVLHVSLLLILGPLGLGHHLGVLVWNLWFLFQAWVLFVVKDAAADVGELPVDHQVVERHAGNFPVIIGPWLGYAVGVLTIGWPLSSALRPDLEISFPADHWVAWEVYAPRSSRAEFDRGYLGATSTGQAAVVANVDQLPRPSSTFGRPAGIDLASVLPGTAASLNEESLVKLNVPIYPQARFQAAVLLAMSLPSGQPDQRLLGQRLRDRPILVFSTSGRLTGRRQVVRLDSLMAIDRFRKSYWLNTRPRQLP